MFIDVGRITGNLFLELPGKRNTLNYLVCKLAITISHKVFPT